jgi:hypothetical protein
MSIPYLTVKAQREMEEVWKLRREAVLLLGHVVAEWESDPMSVQCFDGRLVRRSGEVLKRLKELDLFNEI